jgi:hypothetical protein
MAVSSQRYFIHYQLSKQHSFKHAKLLFSGNKTWGFFAEFLLFKMILFTFGNSPKINPLQLTDFLLG